jgi:septal ring factor EnvC (AmiA/AmiB activator)
VARKAVGQRVDRLEQVVQLIAEDQLSLQKLIADLATETRKGFDRVAKQFAETDKRMRETDQRMRGTDERIDKLVVAKRETDKKFDERVDKLVIAIGEFIRQQNSRR